MKQNQKAKILYRTPLRCLLWLLPALFLLASCGGSRNAGTGSTKAPRGTYIQTGLGSYYADKFNGRPTASGSTYRPGQMTAAHNTLPFGTVIRVTNTRNGRSVDVTVTDRGPHTKGYIVDVSRRAAEQLDIVSAGVVPVRVTVIKAAP
ncbi:septal ring lytic transglycosylase RlpA family protein [Hymenobacter properus]|uniref:Probable endolytic peptidoglycan transglycosylase RlpA n=1 Tax=Hymenobacter properus TaxID=2791026 RepID=A0A931BF26_9BACT|nr:septal ring lytic transglycosylase RlpA family protein [Hymenobacter properus]MBF9142715.1 septal ring lytic transglycosylase RlpA family protein [Hymenobacter properus]MBR7721523.1 septal ring lytic transglycosylase RlpA family protein [Microvirga sp. SRT04]